MGGGTWYWIFRYDVNTLHAGMLDKGVNGWEFENLNAKQLRAIADFMDSLKKKGEEWQ